MAGLGQRTIDLCSRVVKRILPELTDAEEQQALNSLVAWLGCLQIETELLEAEDSLDDISRQYLLTYRNSLNNRNYLGVSLNRPKCRECQSLSSYEGADWIGTLDEWSARLLSTTICPESTSTWSETPELCEEMERLYSWDEFNVFKVTVLTDGHPLEAVAMKLLQDFGLPASLDLDVVKLRNFVKAVEVTYRPSNAYHNNIHAADVTQSLGVMLSFPEVRDQLTPIEQLAIIMSVICHDVGHPGVNNDFLVNSQSEEAKIYHDQSVNENMHLRYTFKLLEKDENNFLCNLSHEDWWFIRQTLIRTVLNTDMATHTTLLAEFENHIAIHGPNLADWSHDHRACALSMFVHCADIANPAKPGPFARTWTWRVMQEFYKQGDKEREMNIAISPGCVRGKVDVPKSQLTFLQYCVRPSYEALAHLFPEVAKSPLMHIEKGVAHWKSMLAQNESRSKENGLDGPEATIMPESKLQRIA